MVFNGNDNPVDQYGATPLLMGETEPGFDRFGPVLDVERFKNEYLFGIPLTSYLTGQTVSDETIKNFILKGIGDFETAVRIPVNPIRKEDRFDFERAEDMAFGTRRMTWYPVTKVEHLKALWPGRNEVLAGNTQEVDYPTSWVVLTGDTGLFRIVPNSGTIVNADVNFLASSAYRSIVMGGMKSWPNMWRITYIAGFAPDQVPAIANDLIGTMAAIKFLSMIGPVLFPIASQSVGLDGMSQAVATAGPMWLSQRIGELTQERDRLILGLKTHYCSDICFGAW